MNYLKNNQSERYRFAEILSGKVDFQENVIYVRNLDLDGKFESN